jgi:hypothetical protein
MKIRIRYAAIAFLLCGAMMAEALGPVELYSADTYIVQGSGSVGSHRSQRFGATTSLPNHLAVGNYFDKAAMRLDLQCNPDPPNTCDSFTFRLALYHFNTDPNTTILGTPIAVSPDTTFTGPVTDWIEISFDPQPASGDYLLVLFPLSYSSYNVGYGIYASNSKDGGPSPNQAYSGNGAKNDREWQVRLNEVASPTCDNPSSFDNVTPNAFARPPSPGAQLLTITGTNLDLVAAVSLEGPASIPGAIATQAAGEITATFDLSTAPVGSYTLVGTRSSPCANAQKFGAVTITCSVPNVTVTGIASSTAFGLSGNAVHHMELTGTNLGSLQGVKLVKAFNGPVEIVGTNLNVLPSGNLQVTFDLTGAEAGRYNVVCTLVHECAQVIIVPPQPPSTDKPLSGDGGGFVVYLPALTNGGFEEGYIADPTQGTICESSANGNRPKPKHWDEGWGSGRMDFERDGKIWTPCVTNPTPPPPEIMGGVTGGHYASAQIANNDHIIMSFFQTIAAPYIDASGTSTKEYAIFADMAVRSIAQTSWGWIRLHDGSYSDPTLNGTAEAMILNTDLYYGSDGSLVRSEDFQAVVPAGYTYTSNPPVLTIEFVFETAGGDNGLKAMHVDAVRNTFVPPPPCNTPPQDADGDGDVDLADFSLFQACFNGPNRPYALPPGFDNDCKCMDVEPAPNGDADLDLADFSKFQSCFNGPNRPPAAGCGS